MIVNSKHANVESVGIEESIAMSIDTSDQAALMAILSENLYKDPIGSLIRESVSNALDAQKNAGNTDPIIVSLKSDKSYNYVYSVQDFGTGISPDSVHNVLSKYAASTKRGSNDYLGYYGLGFKSPLSYTDSFTFTTIYEGREYGYIMYKGEEGTKIDVISEGFTDEKNGTRVTVQLKNKSDLIEFTNKIREQLAYFEGVYFEVPGIPNDFKIMKNEDWKYSSLKGDRGGMHICLENVYYEIDWARLGVPKINVPVGLNFSIGDGLMPIPSREDIKYTEEAKELITGKIRKVADYFIGKFNETRREADSFIDVYNKFSGLQVDIEGVTFNIHQLRSWTVIKESPVSVKGIKLVDLEWLSQRILDMFDIYECRGRVQGGTFDGKYTDYSGHNDFIHQLQSSQVDNIPYVICDRTPKGVELAYLKHKFNYCQLYYLHKKRNLGNSDYKGYGTGIYTYRQLLRLGRYPKEQWRQVIQEYQSIEKDILDRMIHLKDIIPDQAWLEERKANRKKNSRVAVGKLRISYKKARMAERGDNKLVWDLEGPVAIKDLGKTFKSLVIYGVKEDHERFDKMWSYIRNRKNNMLSKLKFVILNRYDFKKVKHLTNFITIDKFMEGENKPFQVYATAILINNLISTYHAQFDNIPFIQKLSTPFADKMQQLSDYQKANVPLDYSDQNDFFNSIIQIAIQKDLFDESIYDIYEEVLHKIHNFDFVELIHNEYRQERTALAVKLGKELLRARSIRMNWENYLEINEGELHSSALQESDPGDDEEEDGDDIENEGAFDASKVLEVTRVPDFFADSQLLMQEELEDDSSYAIEELTS